MCLAPFISYESNYCCLPDPVQQDPLQWAGICWGETTQVSCLAEPNQRCVWAPRYSPGRLVIYIQSIVCQNHMVTVVVLLLLYPCTKWLCVQRERKRRNRNGSYLINSDQLQIGKISIIEMDSMMQESMTCLTEESVIVHCLCMIFARFLTNHLLCFYLLSIKRWYFFHQK